MKAYYLALKKSYKSIIIGIIGGYIGSLIKLPLPWLLGALLLNLLVSFSSYKITFDKRIFLPVLLIIGVILAGSFNITLLYKIHLRNFRKI
jgi:uncharacterized membrane protein AbrB (regulator of aidB expression)